MNSQQRIDCGKQGEELARQVLRQDGFTIITSNFRTRLGEIDVIARKKDLIVFVEVKMRSFQYFDLSSVITHSKQSKIIKAAKQFMATHDFEDVSYRFDVALVEPNATGKQSLTYLSDAFREGGF